MADIELENSTNLQSKRPFPDSGLVTCDWYLKKRKRNCNDPPVENSKRCKFHVGKIRTEIVRIKCPVDPSHEIWSNKVESHIKKCSKHLESKYEKLSPCYKKDVNRTQLFTKVVSGFATKTKKSTDEKFTGKAEEETLEVEWILEKLEKIYDTGKRILRIDKTLHPRATKDFVKKTDSEKHKYQMKQILDIYEKHGFFTESDNSFSLFLEYGCGKAQLTQAIQEFTKVKYPDFDPRYILVEREARKLKSEDKKVSVRLRLDLMDFDLGRLFREKVVLPNIDKNLTLQHKVHLKTSYESILTMQKKLENCNSRSIIQAKHLCGAATDLALLSIENADFNAGLNEKEHKFGFGMATCCHHVSDWNLYTGKPFFDELELEEPERVFNALKKISHWATGLEDEKKQEIGSKAKQIIDFGRLWYTKEKLGLENRFYIDYCDKEITPEHYLILAY